MSDTKDHIRNNAEDLFVKYGIRSVTMDDIARHLGISKKTIYRQYEDKTAIIADIMECTICNNKSNCHHTRGVAENAVHEGILMIDFVMNVFKKLNPGVLFDLKKYYPRIYEKYLQHKEDFLLQTTIDHLNRGIQEGLFREDLDVQTIARLRVESIEMMFQREVVQQLNKPLTEIQLEILKHYLYGVVNAKGLKLLTKYLNKLKV